MTPTECKIDTGAEANVMLFQTYEGLKKRPQLRKTSASLHTFSQQSMKPVGVITVKAELDNNICDIQFYVVQEEVSTMLGLPTCELFDIVKVEAVNSALTTLHRMKVCLKNLKMFSPALEKCQVSTILSLIKMSGQLCILQDVFHLHLRLN